MELPESRVPGPRAIKKLEDLYLQYIEAIKLRKNTTPYLNALEEELEKYSCFICRIDFEVIFYKDFIKDITWKEFKQLFLETYNKLNYQKINIERL